MDLAYGRTRTIVKFTMLEFIARVPYQAWERMSYLALARYRSRSALARRVFERIVESRADQDNEQWHLLILQDPCTAAACGSRSCCTGWRRG